MFIFCSQHLKTERTERIISSNQKYLTCFQTRLNPLHGLMKCKSWHAAPLWGFMNKQWFRESSLKKSPLPPFADPNRLLKKTLGAGSDDEILMRARPLFWNGFHIWLQREKFCWILVNCLYVKSTCQPLSVESTWMTNNVMLQIQKREWTYSWFSYRYLATTQGTRNINGVPVKKRQQPKYKTAFVYTVVTALDIISPDLISFHASHYPTCLPYIRSIT